MTGNNFFKPDIDISRKIRIKRDSLEKFKEYVFGEKNSNDSKLPSQQTIESVQSLIQYGVENNYITQDYKLYGHRQVRQGTECPGDRLFDEISKWSHFDTNPTIIHRPSH